MAETKANGKTGEAAQCPHCLHDHKERSEEEKKKLINRLSRIEGQVRGLKSMVEKDAYCPEVLTQAAAANAALNAFSRELLEAHIRGCVTEDIKEGNDETIEELVKLLQKMMK